MIAESMIPMILMPLTFLFVLLIILIAKAPKVGAWVVGGLLLLAPVIFMRFAATGAFRHEEAIPLFVLPVTFLFVLLVILVAKFPKAGIGLIIAIVVMVVVGLFFAPVTSHRQARLTPSVEIAQWKETVTGRGVEKIQVWEHPAGEQTPRGSSGLARIRPVEPSPPVLPSPPAPIWSEGVEQEFEADVYASSLAAAKALGRRMVKPIRTMAGDPDAPVNVVLFQENHERNWVAAFAQAMEQELPDVRYMVEADRRNIRPGEIGLTFCVSGPQQAVASASISPTGVKVESDVQESTRIVATAFTEDRRASAEACFLVKPWVESFGPFASTRPDQSLMVARSNGACTSEGEAHEQALAGVYSHVTAALGRYAGRRGFTGQLPEAPITTTDILNGGFIVDRFVQSFDTTMGKVWRQAMLVDVSGPKLAQLARVKLVRTSRLREGYARMGFSVIGVLVLISVIYFFLNMATRGYYEWSLRIAGVILAIVAIVSILMIVQ